MKKEVHLDDSVEIVPRTGGPIDDPELVRARAAIDAEHEKGVARVETTNEAIRADIRAIGELEAIARLDARGGPPGAAGDGEGDGAEGSAPARGKDGRASPLPQQGRAESPCIVEHPDTKALRELDDKMRGDRWGREGDRTDNRIASCEEIQAEHPRGGITPKR